MKDTQCSVSSEAIEGINSAEKLPNPETSAGRARGWLNWLSRGVLGAGGTADSSQFSGVVSDEVIKVNVKLVYLYKISVIFASYMI